LGDTRSRVLLILTYLASLGCLVWTLHGANLGELKDDLATMDWWWLGFAVVADEVRKLAEHSRTATKDIAALIKAIQAETNEAVVVMEEGTKEVEVGAGLADQAGKALEAISSVVRQSAELVQEISLASKQQVRGTEGVANAMQIISGITRQTTQGARQTASTVGNMVKLSEQLNEALAQFRSARQDHNVEEIRPAAPVGASR